MTCDRAVILLATGGPLGRWRARRHCIALPELCRGSRPHPTDRRRAVGCGAPIGLGRPCGHLRAPTPGRRYPRRPDPAGPSWSDRRRPSSWSSWRSSRDGRRRDPGRGRVRRSSSPDHRPPRAPASGRRRFASSATSRPSCGPSRGTCAAPRAGRAPRRAEGGRGLARCFRPLRRHEGTPGSAHEVHLGCGTAAVGLARSEA